MWSASPSPVSSYCIIVESWLVGGNWEVTKFGRKWGFKNDLTPLRAS